MTVIKTKHGIDEALLTAFETRLGRFPEDYRQFILKNNGIELFGCPVFEAYPRYVAYPRLRTSMTWRLMRSFGAGPIQKTPYLLLKMDAATLT
jgi:hypothetical protein